MNKIKVTDIYSPESSNIVATGYDNKTLDAFVLFKNGTLYKYLAVPEEDYQNLKNAESVGKHLQATFLKQGFEYEKLEDTELYVEADE